MKNPLSFLLVLASIAILEPGLAQPAWAPQNSGASVGLNDVFFINADVGTVVGQDGDIFRTTNGGQSWAFQNSGTSSHLNAVFFTDVNTGTAVGLAGTILRTTNGGQSWVRQNSGTLLNLNGVYFTNTNTGTAVGIGGVILRTTNGGQSWVQQNSGTSVGLNDVFFINADVGTAVGQDGDIFRTTNGGQSWAFQNSGTSSHLNAVFFTDVNTGTAVGIAGTILRTINGGQSWVRQNSGTSVYLNDVFFVNANIGTAVGQDGDIFRTYNGGQSWAFQDGGTSSHLNGVFFTDANTGTAVGIGGTILRTAPCGFSLSANQASFPPAGGTGMVSVSALAGCYWTAQSDVGWVTITSGASGNGNGVVNFSVASNSGASARSGTITIAGMVFTANQSACNISISPENASYQPIGGTGSLNVTAQAGCAWSAQSNAAWITITGGASGNGNGTVNFSVASNSGASARTGTISVAGLVFTVNQSACNISISPASASFQAAGGTGSVNVSTQAGCAWSAQSNAAWITITGGASGNGNGAVNFSVASNSGVSARTGTITVAGLMFTVNQSACNISISPANASFQAAGGTGSVNVSAQAGCAWTAQSNAGWITITGGASGNGNGTVNFSVEMNNSTAPRTGTISVVGVAFSVSQAGIITGSEDTGPTMAGKFELWQNHPNPFSGETAIRYHLPVSARVTLEIFDPWGGKALTLVDGQQGAGLHTVVWNGQDAAPGMYIYRIVAGGFMKAKKMLLLR